ncbi:M14 family metallopeptidase [Clostridium sp. Marseille-P299]|uniref:M14 family metallopeptidase n=1 Tax=Clostridium sp. Marseille-P299 TaxID=1805477 RepID=UPI00082C5760|nr:M14 family metallopeptidase [Clostridium sp. Marseille-P299]
MIKTVVSVGLPVLETLHIKKNSLEPLNANMKDKLKRICIVTGIHGDELEGQYICYELIRRIQENMDLLSGIVDVYPCVNPLGMESITRRIPTFDLDMNRSFPGNLEGDMSEYAAAKLMEDVSGADFCLDLHASNIFLREIPQVRLGKEQEANLLPYAKLLNTDFIWVHSSPTVQAASLYDSLNSIGVPTLSVEMGVGMRITKQFGDQLLEGIFCLMKELGIWQGDVITPKEPTISTDKDKVSLIHAEASGIFLPSVEHWMGIRKGEMVGEIVNSLSGKVEQQILAPCDGMVFTLREYPVVYKGSLIARILGGE